MFTARYELNLYSSGYFFSFKWLRHCSCSTVCVQLFKRRASTVVCCDSEFRVQ